MLCPTALQIGDTIGVIAPASPPDTKHLEKAIPFFTNLGLRVKLGKNINEEYGYLAGTDKERLADLHDMLADEEVKAIIFACGGYGTARLASSIDYDFIAENPKIIWGYSDITYLHTAIRQKTGLVTFHGPMLASDVGKADFSSISGTSFKQLFKPTPLQYDESISSLEVLTEGEATGQLIGGNLTLLTSTLGTAYEIDTTGKILLMEDTDEEPYRVDSMLNQLRLAGKLDLAAGIVVADFAKAEPKRKPSLCLADVFQHYLSDLSCPVIKGFKIGHCSPHFAVPLGAEATLRTKDKTLSITPGVTKA